MTDDLKVFENEFFKMNKVVQQVTGLWPYDSRMKKYLLRFSLAVLMGSISISHVNGAYVWCGVNLGLCCENVAGTAFTLGCTMKYLASVSKERQMENLLKNVAANWISIDDPEEKDILIKYTKIGKSKNIYYSGILILAAIAFSQLGMIPRFLDVILPLNETRPKMRMVRAEFLIDEDDYYYEIYFIYCVLAVTSVTTLISIDTTYTALVHQIIGMFNITKHRLRLATKNPIDEKDSAYSMIISAIRMHQKSIEYNNLLESTFDLIFFNLIFICTVFITFGAISVMENAENLLDFIRLTGLLMGVTLHLFYLSWPGQSIINESAEIFNVIYSIKWYNVSKRGKILLKIMMLRSLQPCFLTAAGLYVMNFENFGAIIKSTLSYITVLASFTE